MNVWQKIRLYRTAKPPRRKKRWSKRKLIDLPGTAALLHQLAIEKEMRGFKDSLAGLPAEDKLARLKEFSENRVFKEQAIGYRGRRAFHDQYKFQWFRRWKNCFVCTVGAVENIHHILMVKSGGTNDESNLIGICRECHSKIHDWLEKEIK